MPERFFAGNTASACWTSDHLSLILGPPACGKTSLLFQFAFNCAAESARNVVFICNRKRLEYKLPFLSQGIETTSQILGRIQMKYAVDYDEIKKFFAAFHMLESFPVVVIIDDFGDFFSKGKYEDKYGPRDRNFAMVHVLGLCLNAISHANKTLQPGSSCKLVLSETHKRDNASLFIYKRWMDSIFTIEDAKGGGTGPFLLKNVPILAKWPTRIRTVEYSIACGHLKLEGIVEEQ